MLRGAGAGVAVGELAGIGARVGDEFGQRLHRQIGMDDQHIRRDEDLADGREILDRIVGELLVHARAEDERGVAAHHQRVAVRRGLGGAFGGDVAARAGDVLDHHRLAPGFGEFLGKQPRGDVGRDAGREADQDADRLLRVVRLRAGHSCRQRHEERCKHTADRLHCHPPVCRFPNRAFGSRATLRARSDLILRSGRSPRLEGWPQARCLPPSFETPPAAGSSG